MYILALHKITYKGVFFILQFTKTQQHFKIVYSVSSFKRNQIIFKQRLTKLMREFVSNRATKKGKFFKILFCSSSWVLNTIKSTFSEDFWKKIFCNVCLVTVFEKLWIKIN